MYLEDVNDLRILLIELPVEVLQTVVFGLVDIDVIRQSLHFLPILPQVLDIFRRGWDSSEDRLAEVPRNGTKRLCFFDVGELFSTWKRNSELEDLGLLQVDHWL